ncbi:hypothetical protein VTH82DRAFT_3679 [Thermothelomyces myriococcoides]
MLAITMLTVGTYLASSNDPRSTFFCSTRDNSAFIIFLQWVGVLLDAAVIIMAWRILAWTRTTKSRLRTLSGILLAAALGTGLIYHLSRLILPDTRTSYDFRGLDSLYVFDLVVDALSFFIFFTSAVLLASESNPLSLVGVLTFPLAFTEIVRKMALTGTWENVNPGVVYTSLMLTCVGFSLHLFTSDIRYVAFIHRAFIVLLLVIVTVAATIYIPMKALRLTEKHPLTRILYDARTEAGRWQVNAAISDSLRVAVEEYKDRHHGRDPPAKFDVWYSFAKERNSAVLDHFPQIEKDILPFWGMAPSQIREAVRRVAAEPDIAILQIQNGKPRHNLPPSSPYKPVMEDLVKMVSAFAEHLPDMELAINLNERPRVLAPWDDVQRLTKTATRKRVSKLLPRSADSPDEAPAVQPVVVESEKLWNRDDFTTTTTTTSVKAYREMTALACPPGSRGRAGTHWDVRDICTSCVRAQSFGQYLSGGTLSRDICHQPDLFRLHGFHMTPPPFRPLQELLPVFSRAKTDVYSDILIPLRRVNEPPEPRTEGFDLKYKRLFWRGKVDRHDTSHELARGGHQERLVHMLNNPSRSEKTRLLLPTNDGKFMFEEVPTAEINELFPMDVAFSSYTACKESSSSDDDDNDDGRNKQRITKDKESCEAISSEFHTKSNNAENNDGSPADDPLRYKYVMVVDTDDGPALEFLRTLRSYSVPMYSTIFREWYSERLMPWIHFVPVDVRYHALHGTMAYFFGLLRREGGRTLNGREVLLEPRQEDARWIAEQGKRWADRAIRREDMEIYLFRLLLEWGRVIDDDRDEKGFVLT